MQSRNQSYIEDQLNALVAASHVLKKKLNDYSELPPTCNECRTLRQQLDEKERLIEQLQLTNPSSGNEHDEYLLSTRISERQQAEIDRRILEPMQDAQRWKNRYAEATDQLHLIESQLASYKLDFNEERQARADARGQLEDARVQLHRLTAELRQAHRTIATHETTIQTLRDELLVVRMQWGVTHSPGVQQQYHSSRQYPHLVPRGGFGMDETDVVVVDRKMSPSPSLGAPRDDEDFLLQQTLDNSLTMTSSPSRPRADELCLVEDQPLPPRRSSTSRFLPRSSSSSSSVELCNSSFSLSSSRPNGPQQTTTDRTRTDGSSW